VFICTTCSTERSEDDFYVVRGRRIAQCKECRREKMRTYMRQWRAENPERNRETDRRHRESNPEATAAKYARYAKNNPHKRRDIDARRRARIANAPRVEKIDREYIIARDNSTCHICGKRVTTQLELDHLVPLAKGGSHTADNLRVAHKWCNGSMGAGRRPAQLLLIG
jgi:5-methylcytosine-specific restriction endonuclease McrA